MFEKKENSFESNEKKVSAHSTSGRVLINNTFLNFLGLFIPLILALLITPFVINGLGKEKFGLLSFAWVVLGYFTLFDIGLGRATINFIAKAIGAKEYSQVTPIFWNTIIFQGVLGIIGSILLSVLTPIILIHSHVPSELFNEAKAMFYILAWIIPIALISGSLSGMLQAFQRFDVFNIIKIISNSLIYLMPACGILLQYDLKEIIVLIFYSRLLVLILLIISNLKIYPDLIRFNFEITLLKKLLSYGIWVTISSIIGPILTYLERFVIVYFLSTTILAYYSVPYEAISRLTIIASSIAITLFPTFSVLGNSGISEKAESYFAKGTKFQLLILVPISLILVHYSKPLLSIWVGDDFAANSSLVLQILTIGITLNSLSYIPYTFLQGVGRPDIPAKFHLIELSIYIITVWFFTKYWGIYGAAFAWSLRVSIDSFLLFAGSWKIGHFKKTIFSKYRMGISFFLIFLLLIADYISYLILQSQSFLVQFFFSFIFVLIFMGSVWKFSLDESEKSLVNKIIYPFLKKLHIFAGK